MKKPKVSVFQRKKALVLLNKGMKVNETVKELARRYHAGVPLDVVKKIYFPKKGVFAFGFLEGASKEAIIAKMRRMDFFRKKASERMKKLNETFDDMFSDSIITEKELNYVRNFFKKIKNETEAVSLR